MNGDASSGACDSAPNVDIKGCDIENADSGESFTKVQVAADDGTDVAECCEKCRANADCIYFTVSRATIADDDAGDGPRRDCYLKRCADDTEESDEFVLGATPGTNLPST